MTHEELIGLTMDPMFDLAKDYIMEGLSAKLNTFENAIKSQLKINLEPRTHYDLTNSLPQDISQVESKGAPQSTLATTQPQKKHENPYL